MITRFALLLACTVATGCASWTPCDNCRPSVQRSYSAPASSGNAFYFRYATSLDSVSRIHLTSIGLHSADDREERHGFVLTGRDDPVEARRRLHAEAVAWGLPITVPGHEAIDPPLLPAADLPPQVAAALDRAAREVLDHWEKRADTYSIHCRPRPYIDADGTVRVGADFEVRVTSPVSTSVSGQLLNLQGVEAEVLPRGPPVE